MPTPLHTPNPSSHSLLLYLSYFIYNILIIFFKNTRYIVDDQGQTVRGTPPLQAYSPTCYIVTPLKMAPNPFPCA